MVKMKKVTETTTVTTECTPCAGTRDRTDVPRKILKRPGSTGAVGLTLPHDGRIPAKTNESKDNNLQMHLRGCLHDFLIGLVHVLARRINRACPLTGPDQPGPHGLD